MPVGSGCEVWRSDMSTPKIAPAPAAFSFRKNALREPFAWILLGPSTSKTSPAVSSTNAGGKWMEMTYHTLYNVYMGSYVSIAMRMLAPISLEWDRIVAKSP